ncbi:hypothetical protein AS026_12615 [Rhizobium altiplani]|uniref:DUF3597 domain-containing protein n=1 Tax=Rhizobium altiplani TaxID=1864509 RepID=A0A109JFE3_9HYPH|nr:DUF3597 domain-containing protein [Rhizobium altiplani]KWV47913.1 hypothetical protein AS026_12615 [Rhizobium altiplani]
MGIFDRISHAILGGAQDAPAKSFPDPDPAAPANSTGSDELGAPPPPGPGAPQSDQISERPPIVTDPATGAPPPPSRPDVDVAAILDAAARISGQKLDWRHSIVDLMKAIGMDASIQERKDLATELGFSGDKDDSATMNIFLHKTLMRRLAENGGRVPSDLLD